MASLRRFYEQLAFSVMVGNGDAHLKNFGVLYRDRASPELEDHTLALTWWAGRHGTRGYPLTEELLVFGRKVCGVSRPAEVPVRIAQAMGETLAAAAGDARISPTLLAQMAPVWRQGMAPAR